MATILTSSHVVDTRSNAMLESPEWNEILDAVSATYLSVYPKGDASRPVWLEQREELSHFVMSMSTQPMTAPETTAIASQLAREHSFGGACKAWAAGEAKWLVKYLSNAPTLMAGFMALPKELAAAPGTPAPEGHTHAGIPMRTAMVHAAFMVLARSRRVQAVKKVGALEEGDFVEHADGSVSRKGSAVGATTRTAGAASAGAAATDGGLSSTSGSTVASSAAPSF